MQFGGGQQSLIVTVKHSMGGLDYTADGLLYHVFDGRLRKLLSVDMGAGEYELEEDYEADRSRQCLQLPAGGIFVKQAGPRAVIKAIKSLDDDFVQQRWTWDKDADRFTKSKQRHVTPKRRKECEPWESSKY